MSIKNYRNTMSEQNKIQNPLDPQLGLILQLLKDIPILNTAPTDPPKFPIAFAFYQNGSTKRLYCFFNGSWGYVTLS